MIGIFFLIASAFLIEDNCGLVNSTLETKIVGGEAAKKNEYPWLIRIQYKKSKSLLCGGAVIREDLILTAAHCLEDGSPDDFEIVAGEHDSSLNEGTEQTKQIKKIICHESYNGKTFTDDICLAKLTSNLTFNSVVNSISLPPKGFSIPAMAEVAGWGVTASGNTMPEKILRKVALPTVSNNECAEMYRNVTTITPRMLCAGISGRDSCQGDSGGPLMCSYNNNSTNTTTTVACGIVSYGVDCAHPRYPGVYTRVSEYIEWIAANRANQGMQFGPILLVTIVVFQLCIKS